MQLVHLASRLYGTPLLIARPKLDVILSVLGSRIGLPDLDMAMPLPAPRQSATSGQAGIAVIPVVGTLVRRSMGIEAASGLMSYGEIEARLDAALADPQVAGILLDLDSPGGEASGVFELAERIRAASTIKPIWAHANDAAYSAAFAIAAACQRLTLSQTAGVGSIGVIALHVDQSVKDAKDGLNYTAVFAGSHKNDFSRTSHSPAGHHRVADRGGSPLRHLRESGRTDARPRPGCRARHRGGAVLRRAGGGSRPRRRRDAARTGDDRIHRCVGGQAAAGAARRGPRLAAKPVRPSSSPRSKPFTLENTMTDPKTTTTTRTIRPTPTRRATSRRPTAIRNRRLLPKQHWRSPSPVGAAKHRPLQRCA
jgi:hypothetical protein